jgi:hypothetical protein
MVQGQAAGTAASLAVKRGVSSAGIDVEQLQEKLASQGVLLNPVPDPL